MVGFLFGGPGGLFLLCVQLLCVHLLCAQLLRCDGGHPVDNFGGGTGSRTVITHYITLVRSILRNPFHYVRHLFHYAEHHDTEPNTD